MDNATEITLHVDDERLGQFAPDGSIAHWPALNVDGKPYERANVTVQRASEAHFVVYGADHEPISIVVEDQAAG